MPKDKPSLTPALNKVLATLAKSRVLVGVPATDGARQDGSINNAALGYLFETGDPETNMPPRPWLVPGIQEVQGEISRRLVAGARNAIQATVRGSGDVRAGRAEVKNALETVGNVAQASVQRRIGAGIAPALSERTIYARLHRKKNRRSPGEMTPLIDTGEFIRSIRYVVLVKN